MFAIISKSKSIGLSLSCQIHLFKTIIIPLVLFYGCEVWGYEKLDILEKVQTDFGKMILKLNKKTSNYFVLGETGLIPLHILVKCRLLNF